MPNRPVLYVEDDEEDVFLVRVGLRRAGIEHPMFVAGNGQEAIDYLAGNGRYADRAAHPLPCLVLLDLNLPLRSGVEVLKWIRTQPQFQALPVVVYSSSGYPVDVSAARALGIQDYLVKDGSPAATLRQMQGLAKWLLPRPPSAS